jgi:hypothetical protein
MLGKDVLKPPGWEREGRIAGGSKVQFPSAAAACGGTATSGNTHSADRGAGMDNFAYIQLSDLQFHQLFHAMQPTLRSFTCSVFALTLLFLSACSRPPEKRSDDVHSYARSRQGDLRLSSYVTAHAVRDLLGTEAGRREALSVLSANGITKVYLEVYRSGLAVEAGLLKELADFFKSNGFEVAGGIATVPGEDFGVYQDGPLSWFNWQNEKTQADLLRVMEETGALFDSFIVDDFVCTSDTSLESKDAKGDRDWGQYRRDLLTGLSQSLFIDPVKRIRPDVTMIIKYPQWYDRFHLFGYAPARQTPLFDRIWVGTETRGQYTPRFGYVQPYEGFVNYRWLASMAPEKAGGAWFDHIDCDALDFIEQAWQTVLAGAQEIIIFNYYNLTEGHPGQHPLRTEFAALADLAAEVALHPVEGAAAYKPPDSDAGGNLYLMDYIGMLGVPLVPVSSYPESAEVVFLPAQAAADADIGKKMQASLARGTVLVLTPGFLAAAAGAEELSAIAGMSVPKIRRPISCGRIRSAAGEETLNAPVELAAALGLRDAEVLLEAVGERGAVPLLTRNAQGNVYVLNVHTFSQDDFTAANEWLLCPKPLGLLDLPRNAANAVRSAFNGRLGYHLDVPARVSFQPLGRAGVVLHNYGRAAAEVRLVPGFGASWTDALSGQSPNQSGDTILLQLPARGRVWLRTGDREG